MTGLVSFLLLLSGSMLSSSLRPSHVQRTLHYISTKLNWSEAQSYCRANFTDLATITDHQTNTQAVQAATKFYNFWIGLYKSPWKWSVGLDFEPSQWNAPWAKGNDSELRCVALKDNEEWISQDCETRNFFFCYNQYSQEHVLVKEQRTWNEAQNYCRGKYRDLSSIDQASTQDYLLELMTDYQNSNGLGTQQISGASNAVPLAAWIGLYYSGWLWSDGSSAPYRRWSDLQGEIKPCASVNRKSSFWLWNWCSLEKAFLCYSETRTFPTKTVKIRLKTSADLNDVAVQRAILLQLKGELNQRGVPAKLKLTWTSQPVKETAPPGDACGTV